MTLIEDALLVAILQDQGLTEDGEAHVHSDQVAALAHL
jgi:hypothetical protein